MNVPSVFYAANPKKVASWQLTPAGDNQLFEYIVPVV
jgi:hypothetical protein